MDKRILVLASENVQRWKIRRARALFVWLVVIVLTIFWPYFLSWVPDSFNPRSFFNMANVIIVVWFVIGYLLRVYYDTHETVQCILTDEWVELWKRMFRYEDLDGFFLEIDKDKQKINNLVLIKNNEMFVFTIIESIDEENFNDFTETLKSHVPYLDEYKPSLFWSVVRKCRL